VNAQQIKIMDGGGGGEGGERRLKKPEVKYTPYS